jgi:HK97 family phage major capsid protein/HK97 family phage prohead protease
MTMTDLRPPRDNLVRAMPPSEFQEDGNGRTLVGRISPANEWTEISSATEGHFMERFAPGAFRKTFAENRDNIRVLFQHGKDPELGNKPIAELLDLDEDEAGAFYRADMLDGLPPLIVDGLRRGLYGSSQTFSVVREDWEPKPKAGMHNPGGLPERTVKEAKVWELGPVTWPAYAGATAGMRSMTDEFRLDSLTADPERLRELITYIEPIAPSPDAEAPPHLGEERREPVVPISPVSPKEIRTVEYVTREEKASRHAELKAALARQAIEYPGVLPAEAQMTWDTDSAELDTLERDIAAWDARQSRVAAFAADEKKTERTYEPVASFARKTIVDIYDRDPKSFGSKEQRDQDLRDRAMRSIETSTFPHPGIDQDAVRADIATLVDHRDSDDKELAQRILATGSPVYRRAFNKLVRGDMLTPEEHRAAALQVVGTTTTGGYAVPYVFDPTMVHTGAYTSINPFRAACRVEQLVGANEWRTVSVGAVVAAYAAESAATTEQGPTFAQPAFTVRRAQTFVTVSHETMQDRSDMASELSSLFAEAKDTLEENKFSIGAGNPAPAGMFVKSNYTVKETITNDTFAVADLAATEAVLPLRHRMNAAWFFARGVIRIIQGWETVGGELFNSRFGYPAVGNVNTNPTGNTGLQLLGYPVWETPSCPITVTTDDAIVGILVNPKTYVIVDRVGMNVEIIPNMLDASTGFPTGDRGVLAIWRNTGGVLNADGGRQVNIN